MVANCMSAHVKPNVQYLDWALAFIRGLADYRAYGMEPSPKAYEMAAIHMALGAAATNLDVGEESRA